MRQADRRIRCRHRSWQRVGSCPKSPPASITPPARPAKPPDTEHRPDAVAALIDSGAASGLAGCDRASAAGTRRSSDRCTSQTMTASASATNTLIGNSLPNQVTRGIACVVRQRFADLVAVGPPGRRRQQQRRLAQPPTDQVGGDACPAAVWSAPRARCGSSAARRRCRPTARRRRSPNSMAMTRTNGPGPPRRTPRYAAKHGSHHQLAFLADVDQPGAPVDDRAEGHEQDRCRRRPT